MQAREAAQRWTSRWINTFRQGTHEEPNRDALIEACRVAGIPAPKPSESLQQAAEKRASDAESERDAARALAEERAGEIARYERAGGALLQSWHDWETIWMNMMKGYISDDEYAALQAIGDLVGMPDPRASAAAPERD